MKPLSRICVRLPAVSLVSVTVCLGLCPRVSAQASATPGGAVGSQARTNARWIWSNASDPAPKNRFTYFRKVVTLKSLPKDGRLHLAADSNAALWINGEVLCRKVPRYDEPRITAEVLNAGPYLRVGTNVIVVRHHNWGELITFQRTGNKHAGLYVSGEWVGSDPSWRWLTAPEFVPHDKQVVGVIGDKRIRYPQILDGRKALAGDIHDARFDDAAWGHAVEVTDGPWPKVPPDAETPPQREYEVGPTSVLAAGTVERKAPPSDEPLGIAAGIRTSTCRPDEQATRAAGNVIGDKPVTIAGRAGETHYITFDFSRPVHGYPFLGLADAPEGTKIDFGYTEIARSLYEGAMLVEPSGWLNPERIVGPGYGDRYIARRGAQCVELPDERTARWMTIHIHFASDGSVVLKNVGIVKSQYPIDPVGTFACGDERIDQIVKLCLIHAEVTMSDTYVDTPGREDGQWIEDARPRAILTSRWFGDTRLRELLLRTFSQGQGKDGNFHPFFPSNYPAYPGPHDWSVQWVAFLYDQYMWTGQAEWVQRYWDVLCRYWDNALSHVDKDGIWRTNAVLADIRVGLHPENDKQSSGVVTPWMIERLRMSAEMAEAIGQKDQAAKWKQTADRMAEAFRKYHIVPASEKIPAHVGDRLDPAKPSLTRGYSQAGQTVAIITGLLSHEEAVADLNYAFPAPDGSPPPGVTRWNNPTYGYRVLRALSDCGMNERAVAHLIERYSPYLPGNPRNPVPDKLQGPYGGPLPEYWVSREDLGLKAGEKDSAQPADETGSHGWGSVPLLWLHDSLLGVRIMEPGGGKITIAPDAGGLPYVAGYTATPKGVVWVYWDPQRWRLEVEIPKDVTAEVRMPTVCDGKRIVVSQTAGKIEAAGENNYRLQTAGRYILQAE